MCFKQSDEFKTGTKISSCGERRRGFVAGCCCCCYCCAGEKDAAVGMGAGPGMNHGNKLSGDWVVASRRIWTKSQIAADGNSMDTRSTFVAVVVVAGTGHSSHKHACIPGKLLLLPSAAYVNWITECRSDLDGFIVVTRTR